MGETIFHDILSLAKQLSVYLPLSDGVPLDTPIDQYGRMPGRNLPVNVPQGKHWGVLSKTGNGKTTLDKALLRAYRQKYPYINTYIVDSKKLGDFSSHDGQVIRSYEPPPPSGGIGQRQIWQPTEDNIDCYDRYFRNILNIGKPAVVLIDESKNLKFGSKIPKGYELLVSQGRLPGIHVITNYQEVFEALRQGLSQCTHFISFNVHNPYDLQIAKAKLRIREPGGLPLAGIHSFLYINSDTMDRPLMFRDYRDFVSYWLNDTPMKHASIAAHGKRDTLTSFAEGGGPGW